MCVSGGKKCSFFGKFDVLFFLTPVLRFALLLIDEFVIRNLSFHFEDPANVFREIKCCEKMEPFRAIK